MTINAFEISVVSAFLAALFWGWSSLVNLPIIGSGWGELANVTPFYAALKKVARLNTAAAFCAFVAAGCQTIALWPS
jgi:hypothetical protein